MKSCADPANNPYLDGSDYVKDYMALLSLKLHREVMMTRALRGEERQESFLGLFISEQDVSAILAELHGRMLEDFPDGVLLQKRINTQTRNIDLRLSVTQNPLPHQQLAQAFQLRDSEVELLMMTLAPEIDSRFAKVYGFLHDDVARKRLSAALAQQLTGQNDPGAVAVRSALHPDSALLHFRLLRLLDDDSIPQLNRGLKLDNRIVNFLLGIHKVDEELLEVLQTPWSGKVVFNRDSCTESAVATAQRWLKKSLSLVLEVDKGADVDVWLSVFCGHIEMALLCIDWQKLLQLDYIQASRLLVKTIREGHLSNSLVHLRDVDNQQPRLLALLMSTATPLVCVSSAQSFSLEQYSITALEVHVPALSLDNRLACWVSAMPAFVQMDKQILQTYAERYPIGVRTIYGLCSNIAGNVRHSEFIEVLSSVCRKRVGDKMRDSAQRIDTPFRFSDLVLPPGTMLSLQDLVARRANTSLVFADWGLADVFRQSEGNSVLFIGPSGTGKTMAANVIANELGLDMYRIDLSGVVSKYIGETEKNLERIFTTAAQSEVVLFIDEADALFGKRSEVKDAHDRYANIEVSFLLQKMEEHTGVVILASNFGHNIDDAFFRRFSAVVEFTLPKVEDRLKLWQKLHRTRAPLAENIDLQFLAERFELTGGHIKNCIMTAAFHAAAHNEPINMQILIRAVSKEYAKIGKPISKNNFGDYYAVLRREAAGA